MIKITIPKSWDEVTIEQFIELDSIDMDQYETVEAIQLERLSILTNTSSDDDIWDDMDVRHMAKLITDLNFLSHKPSIILNDKILDDKLKIIDFDNIKFGEFIDIEYYIRNGENKNITNICTVLYRMTKVGEWGETIYQPYSTVDTDEVSKEIADNCTLGDIYGAIDKYKVWRESFLKSYANLFEQNIEDDYDKEELSEIELEELKEIEEQEAKMVEFGWQRMLISLVGDDIHKIDTYLDMNVIAIFNILSVKKALKI